MASLHGRATAPSPTLPRRQGAPRARSPRSTRRPRTRALLRDRRRAGGARRREILEANARDLEAGRESGLSAALMDRLRARRRAAIAAIADGVRAIAALPDPVGEVIDGCRLPNGLDVRKVRVPLGVVAVVYEARPNVTIDAAALCLKSGNAIVLRGSSSAAHSNAVLARGRAPRRSRRAGLPAGSLSLVAGGGREELAELAGQEGVVDLIIPRGGEGLKKALSAVAKVPGDLRGVGQLPRLRRRDRRPRRARERSSSTPRSQRPGVCNAAETLLVHADVAAAFLPARARARCAAPASSCAATSRVRALDARGVGAATDESDWAEEFLALILAVRVVDSVDEAIEHVNRYGSGHSEAIVTRDRARARGRSSSASTRPASTSTPRRASPTAASSAWAPRSATRPRSCTPAARSACASCARSSTWSRATARSAR